MVRISTWSFRWNFHAAPLPAPIEITLTNRQGEILARQFMPLPAESQVLEVKVSMTVAELDPKDKEDARGEEG